MFFATLKSVFDTFGPAVFVPVVIFVIALCLKVPGKKAFTSALYAGVGLQGFNLLINAYVPIIVPVIQRMVDSTGVHLPVVDMGWQATAIVAYSTEVGMMFVGIAILIQVVLFLIRWTNVFQPGDLWNNYSYMVWGSIVYLVTKNMTLAMGCMIIQLLYTQICAEIIQKRWSTYYGYPNCTIASLHTVAQTVLAIPMNWILDRLGFNKIKVDPLTLQEKMGFLGEPVTLGLLLGLCIGVVGNLSRIGTLAAWGEISSVGIATAAIMAVFPRVASIFAQSFTPLTEASKKKVKAGGARAYVWYLSVNDATGFGEPATLLSGILLIPIVLLIALVLPGNRVLPMIDLIAIPFIIQPFVAMANGNIVKSILGGIVWFALGLWVATYTAPTFTTVASQAGVQLPATGLAITSLVILANPIAGLIFMPFLLQRYDLIGGLVVFYLLCWVVLKFKKNSIQAALEKMAQPDEEPAKE